jgi:hypothetical protein
VTATQGAPRRRAGRPSTLDPNRTINTRSFELYDDQTAWLDAKVGRDLRSRSEVLRDLLDRLRAADMVFGRTVDSPSEAA